jgi:hypothetical protein
MTGREQFEQEALTVVQSEVAAARFEVEARGIELGSVTVARRGEGDSYESEVRIDAYHNGQVCDVLEVHLWRSYKAAATLDELRDWFRTQLARLDCAR